MKVFGFFNPIRTVWYIQAGSVDGDGVFTVRSQASAVLINLRGKMGATKKVLLTARHGLIQSTEFRAWAPGWILAKRPIKVTYSKLSPDKNLPIGNLDDFAFLELPHDQQGFEVTRLADDSQVRPRKDIRIIGFNGGLNPNEDGFEIRPFDSRAWDFVGLDQGTQRAFLRNGIGGGAPGCSGGGVFLPFSFFRQPSLLGIYRGMEGMNHLFMPATWLREYLGNLDFEVFDQGWRVPPLIRFSLLLLWAIVGAALALVSSCLLSPFTPLWLLGLSSLVVFVFLPLPTRAVNPSEIRKKHTQGNAPLLRAGLIGLAAAFTMTTLWVSSRTTIIDFHSTSNVEIIGCIPSADAEIDEPLGLHDLERLEVLKRDGGLLVRWNQDESPINFHFRAYHERENDSNYTVYEGSDFKKKPTWTLVTHMVATPSRRGSQN